MRDDSSMLGVMEICKGALTLTTGQARPAVTVAAAVVVPPVVGVQVVPGAGGGHVV
jgi:hypothetical protein